MEGVGEFEGGGEAEIAAGGAEAFDGVVGDAGFDGEAEEGPAFAVTGRWLDEDRS